MFDDLNKKDDSSSWTKSPGDSKPPQGAKDQFGAPAKQKEGKARPLTESVPKDVKAPVADIFSETEGGEDNQPVKPDVFKPKEKKSDEPVSSPAPVMPEQGKKGIKNLFGQAKMKKIIILILFVVGLIIVLLAGYWAIGKFFTPGDDNEVTNEEVQGSQDRDLNADLGIPSEPSPEPSQEGQITEPEISKSLLDSDSDGLTDEEEMILGTDINSVDSDSDGLFDREEVKVYKTDPFNPDTDGDGFLDGAEVRDGYNPKGSGRLYEIK